jgi:hypothetical protein
MSRLLRLKRWLTLREACDYIQSLVEGEKICEQDLLQLALERQLELSVVFPDVQHIQPMRKMQIGEVQFQSMPSLDGERELQVPEGGPIFSFEDFVLQPMEGASAQLVPGEPYGLPFIGGEIAFIEDKFWAERSEREPTVALDGCFVCAGQGEHRGYYRLVGFLDPPHRSSYPLGELPHNTVLCLTQSQVRAFVDRLAQLDGRGLELLDDLSQNHANEHRTTPMGERERRGLLVTIAALLTLLLNHRPGRNSQAAVISELLSNYPEKEGISTTSLENRFAAGNRLLNSEYPS